MKKVSAAPKVTINLSRERVKCEEHSSDDCMGNLTNEPKSIKNQVEEISYDNLAEVRSHEIISNTKDADATMDNRILYSTYENTCLEDGKTNETESRQNPNCSEDAGIPTVEKLIGYNPLQVITNQRLKAIEDELEDLKQVRQTGDRWLHEELVAKTQFLKDLEEKFVKVSAELETNVADANAKNKALEEALRCKQETLQSVIAERDAIRKAKCTLTLRLQVAEDQLRDVEHKLNSRVLGVEMEKARLTEILEGVRDVTETAEEISSRIQRTLCDAGVTVPQHLPSNNSPTLLIQKLIDYTNQLLVEFQKLSRQRDTLKIELSRREMDEAKSQRIKEILHHEVDRYAIECRRLSRELEGRQNSTIKIESEHATLLATATPQVEKNKLAEEEVALQSPKLGEKSMQSQSCLDHTGGRRKITGSMDKGTQSAHLEQTDDEVKVAFREKTEKLIASLSQRIEEIGKTRRSLESMCSNMKLGADVTNLSKIFRNFTYQAYFALLSFHQTEAAGKLEAKVRSASAISTRGKSADEMLTDRFNEEISETTYSNENNCFCAAHFNPYHDVRHSKLRSALKDALARLGLSTNRDFITE